MPLVRRYTGSPHRWIRHCLTVISATEVGNRSMEKSPEETPSLYDLYGATSLLNLKRSIGEGKIPNAAELAAVLEANSEHPLPAWFIAILIKSLRGELPRRPGRPRESFLSGTRFEIAKREYPRYHAWLQKREGSSGLNGWSAVRGQKWWAGSPHERAARIVTARWLKHMTWRAFLNRVSS
jgi:hypothetical protein